MTNNVKRLDGTDTAPMLPKDLDDPIRWCAAMAAKMREIATQPIISQAKVELIAVAESYERLAIRLKTEEFRLAHPSTPAPQKPAEG